MSRMWGLEASTAVRFPRVSGDEPKDTRALADAYMFSPRERG